MSRPRWILLDTDGVVMDLQARWAPVAIARTQSLARRCPGLEATEIAAWLGLTADDMLGPGPMAHQGRETLVMGLSGWLTRRLGSADGWRAAVEEAFREADAASGPEVARPGALGRLRDWHREGIRLAIVTSDTTGRARHDLASVGALQWLEAVFGVDRVAHGKPAPDLAHAAARELGLPCQHAWLVGDTPEDLEMGRLAGVGRLVGMTGGASPGDLLAPWADVVISSWDDPALS